VTLILRTATPEDGEACGMIAFEAFKAVFNRHDFRFDIPSAEAATASVMRKLTHPAFYGMVAIRNEKIVGSIIVDERGSIAGIDPLTIDPSAQNESVGRRLMLAFLERSAQRRFSGIRLVQAAFYNVSLCLYAKLGFETREPLSKMDGPPLGIQFPGYTIRPATLDDLVACNDLCRRVHGHDRGGELRDAISQGTARVVEHLGVISGYATDIGNSGHAVADTNTDLQALIGAASSFSGGGFLLPTRNGELFRWALQSGLRLVHPMQLMTMGLYNEPAGAYLPSIAY
jgi:predicted N-acetyltransferase YhbS